MKSLLFYFLPLILLFCFLASFGCKSSSQTIEQVKEVKVEFVSAPFEILKAEIMGDTLVATIRYSGGCETHSFSIESSGFLMKSLPPKQPLRILHRSNDDACRALITEEVKLNISSFRGTPDGVTVLLLENWPQHLSYSY